MESKVHLFREWCISYVAELSRVMMDPKSLSSIVFICQVRFNRSLFERYATIGMKQEKRMPNDKANWNLMRITLRGVVFIFLVSSGLLSMEAQSLQKVGSWEIQKREEFLLDFYERAEGGFLGLTMVQHFGLSERFSPKKVTLWKWDENFKLIERLNYPIDWVFDDGFRYLGRCKNAQSGGWYVLIDKLTKGIPSTRLGSELSVRKLTFEGKVERSRGYPIDVLKDVEGLSRKDVFAHDGHFTQQYTAQVMSENGNYIVLATEFRPGEISYAVLDSSLRHVGQGVLPLGNGDANERNATRWSLFIDDLGTIHCFASKWEDDEPGSMALTLAPLDNKPQTYAVHHPAYMAIPYATFMYKNKRRYVMALQMDDPKTKGARPYVSYEQFVLKDGEFVEFGDIFSSKIWSLIITEMHVLRNCSQDLSSIVLIETYHSIENNAIYNALALRIRKGAIEDECVISRRLRMHSNGDRRSIVSVEKDGATCLLYESNEDRQMSHISYVGKTSSLYLESFLQATAPIKIAESTELGLYVGKAVQWNQENVAIPAIEDKLLIIYTLQL